MQERYVFHDFETGGWDGTSILTYYAAITDNEFKVLRDIELKIKPDDGKYIVTAEALAINRIDLLEHWKKAVPKAEAISQIQHFLRQDYWANGNIIYHPAGHNVEFDNLILKNQLLGPEEYRRYFWKHSLDTATLAVLLKNMGKFPSRFEISLANLAKHYGIDATNAHDAKFDVHLAIGVLKCMIKDLRS